MLCQTCLQRSSALRHLQSPTKPFLRALTTTPTTSSPPPPTPSSSSSKPTQNPTAASTRITPLRPSSVPADAPLRGLNYLRNKNDPVALPDEAYPPWLWTLTSESTSKKNVDKDATVDTADLFSKSAKQRRAAAKSLRKLASRDPSSLLPKIPLHQQSIDLPANETGTVDGAMLAQEKREEVVKAMRRVRRGGIKEDNFLRGMR